MDYILSEKQFHVLLEQAGFTPLGNPYTSIGQKNTENFSNSIDPKIANTILQLGTLFIPVVGPFFSMGFMGIDLMNDFKNAKTDQDKSVVILSYVIQMAFAWGLSKVFKSVATLGEEGMKQLGRKLRTAGAWKALSSAENAVLMDIANGPQYWQDKLKTTHVTK
jgi:hypothetical protein